LKIVLPSFSTSFCLFLSFVWNDGDILTIVSTHRLLPVLDLNWYRHTNTDVYRKLDIHELVYSVLRDIWLKNENGSEVCSYHLNIFFLIWNEETNNFQFFVRLVDFFVLVLKDNVENVCIMIHTLYIFLLSIMWDKNNIFFKERRKTRWNEERKCFFMSL